MRFYRFNYPGKAYLSILEWNYKQSDLLVDVNISSNNIRFVAIAMRVFFKVDSFD